MVLDIVRRMHNGCMGARETSQSGKSRPGFKEYTSCCSAMGAALARGIAGSGGAWLT